MGTPGNGFRAGRDFRTESHLRMYKQHEPQRSSAMQPRSGRAAASPGKQASPTLNAPGPQRGPVTGQQRLPEGRSGDGTALRFMIRHGVRGLVPWGALSRFAGSAPQGCMTQVRRTWDFPRPERARREAGGGWREQAERLGRG